MGRESNSSFCHFGENSFTYALALLVVYLFIYFLVGSLNTWVILLLSIFPTTIFVDAISH